MEGSVSLAGGPIGRAVRHTGRGRRFRGDQALGPDALEFLRRLLPFKAGVPSHDTLNDVINAVDGALFAQCFTAWVEDLREAAPASAAPEIVAIDGETSRRTHDRSKDRGPHLDDPSAKHHSHFETTDGDHGHIEVRRHVVSHQVDWLTTARRFPGEPRFPGLGAIAMVEAEVERNGSTSLERRYYLSSMPLDAKLFAYAARCHWHVENRLHWVLDVVFHEDLRRLRSGAGPQDMATVRHMAMNLLRTQKDKHSLKVRRKSAAWDTAYLEALIRQST